MANKKQEQQEQSQDEHVMAVLDKIGRAHV